MEVGGYGGGRGVEVRGGVVGPGGGGWRWALTARMSCDCC